MLGSFYLKNPNKKILSKQFYRISKVMLLLLFAKSQKTRSHFAQKWNFSLRISSVNVTKSAVFCRFGHIYWRNP